MEMSIELSQVPISKDDKLQLHFLPAKFDSGGEANVEKYFNNYTRSDDNIYLSNSLRGYPLQGRKIDVPDKFKAFVLVETQNSSKPADRTLRASGDFDEFIYWNYDKIPSKTDPYLQALAWTELSGEVKSSELSNNARVAVRFQL